MEILEKVENLKLELDALLPLDPELEARIWQKLRLDWNYHSNKLEGNTYSFGETKMLLLKGLTAGGKPVRDHEEISGHNEAINVIIEYIKQGEPLIEIFIRQLHTLILVRPFLADAKTADGVPTKRLIKVGEYKTEPNHVETLTGEMFYFAEPIETPAKMQELVEWFRAKTESPETNPILLAAEFHYRFVLIHPFDDGNGRLARLLMNFILMKYGFPPVIIKNEDKDNYIAALEQANFAILDPFVDYVAVNMAHSLAIMIRGAKGENIEESGDVDKEITLLDRKIRGFGKRIEVKRSRESIGRVVETSIYPLMLRFFDSQRAFDRFYVNPYTRVFIDGQNWEMPTSGSHFSRMKLPDTPEIMEIRMVYIGDAFNQDVLPNTQYESALNIAFELTRYRAMVSGNQWGIEKLYAELLFEDEIDRLIDFEKRQHLNFIQKKFRELDEQR